MNLALLAGQEELDVLLGEVNASEAALIDEVKVYPARTLREALQHLSGHVPLTPAQAPDFSDDGSVPLDLADLKGQGQARRALEIALAGGHNLLH
ncbi:ATP-binding protein [Deinococcus alpinitundrae]|uniref:ATP-binding protein n=1 Tax=Deinococcus alpinitundrae TaxID=468913 RepID=UPI002352DD21|nr:ATP-binding protein [Deinococcus alpinitundrae]